MGTKQPANTPAKKPGNEKAAAKTTTAGKAAAKRLTQTGAKLNNKPTATAAEIPKRKKRSPYRKTPPTPPPPPRGSYPLSDIWHDESFIMKFFGFLRKRQMNYFLSKGTLLYSGTGANRKYNDADWQDYLDRCRRYGPPRNPKYGK